MAIGIIKRLPNVRNYAFVVIGEEKAEEIFFHRTDVAEDGFEQLENGQAVRFEVVPDPRNLRQRRAMRVTPLESSAAD